MPITFLFLRMPQYPGALQDPTYFVGPLEEHFRWVDHNALGYSIIPNTGERATMAYISLPRIQNLSASTSTGVAELLGLAIAHETGHLLFGSNEHANQGIMRALRRSVSSLNKPCLIQGHA